MAAPQFITPVHPGLPLVGNTLEFARDPLATFTRLSRQYERVVRISIGGRRQHVALRPEDVKYVLQENNRNYVRSPAFLVLKLFLGEGLLTSDGDFWRRQRRLAQPAFHRQKLTLLAQTMVAESRTWVHDIQQQNLAQPVNLSQSLMDVTMRIVCKTLFGADAVAGQLDGLSSALETVNVLANKMLLNPIRFPRSWPTPDNLRHRRATALVDRLIYGFIANRRQTGESRDDLLDMLLHAVDEETGAAMSDKQLRDECITLFTAGHETTAVSMAWTLHLLSQHPDVMARVQAEARQHLGGVDSPAPEAFRALTYTQQVIQESMRLYPPAWALSRMAVQDDQLGPYRIPAGDTVIMSPYLLHRDPQNWPEPEQFNPDRFAPGPTGETRDKERHPYAYLPFGGGPRLCIGNQFALMEMQILLGLFARTFMVAPVLGQQVVPQPLITLRPKRPVRLQVHQAE